MKARQYDRGLLQEVLRKPGSRWMMTPGNAPLSPAYHRESLYETEEAAFALNCPLAEDSTGRRERRDSGTGQRVRITLASTTKPEWLWQWPAKSAEVCTDDRGSAGGSPVIDAGQSD